MKRRLLQRIDLLAGAVLLVLVASVLLTNSSRKEAAEAASAPLLTLAGVAQEAGTDSSLVAAAVPAAPFPWMPVLAVLGVGLALLLVAAHFVMRRAQRSRILFRENPEPIILTDYRWRILEANRAACELLGYREDNIKLHTLSALVETRTALDPALLKETIEAGKPLTFEASVEHDEDSSTVLAGTTRKVNLGGQDVLLTALHEITMQKTEQRLFKAFHRRLVEDLPIEVVVMGPQGQYLYANPKAIPDKKLREALIGETDVEYCQEMGLHPEVALRRRSHRRRAISTKKTLTFEEILPAEDDTYRTFTRILTPVIDKSGSVTAIVAYGVETTDLKRYQDQMAEVRAEADRLAELKESFLANISHEFRTPLTSILGFGQLLQEDVTPEQRGWVDIVLRNGRRLMSTLNSMVDLSKLHSNYLEMNPTVFNLVDEVKEVAQAVAPLAQEKELYLRMRATRPEVLVRLDRTSLYRVLENLIGNAIKFTHTGGVIVEVHGDADKVYVRVMDSGVGIRNEFLPFLFEEFNQESSGLNRTFEGTGIGLSVVKRLIDVMGGSISVDSEKGEGSMFTITFPAAFPQRRNGETARSRILVADESEEVHTLIQYVLSPYFDVEYARDYASAMRAARDARFDVILLDAEFGEATSASEALAPIREIKGYERVPVVALDPHPVHGGAVHFLSIGFDDYLHKPLDKKLLLDSIGQVLSKDWKKRKAAQEEGNTVTDIRFAGST